MVTIKVGTESTKILLPIVDGVLVRFTGATVNQFNAARINMAFTLIDMDYDDENNEEEDNELIRELSSQGYVHYEGVNLPADGEMLGKGTKFYKLLLGMSGAKDLDTGTDIEIDSYNGKDFRVNFDHEDKKGGPPDFSVQVDDRGRPLKKAKIGKIRPNRKAKATAVAKPAPVVVDEDDDLLSDDDE